MARQGRAGAALATAAIGSFFAGTVATILIALFAPPLAELALSFGPAEYFSLMVLGLVASIVLAHGSILKALGMIVLGLLLGLIGTDVNSGAPRFTFDIPELSDGIGFVVVAMGLFGVAEIIAQPRARGDPRRDGQEGHRPDADARGLGSAWSAPILRGTALGSVLGILPGGGAMLASFAAYTLEKKISHNPSAVRQGRDRGRGRARSRPTTPARRPRSSRC